ncbi:MAG: peptide deformylase [Lachnospiraceae bacterium]|jgi:peptide deformylase
MAIRNIRIEGDPILRKISKSVKEITQRTDELIDDMIESLGQLNGVGLAAVQVGVLKRICIICMDADDLRENEDEKSAEKGEYRTHTDGENLIVINPEVIEAENGTQTGNEGCLSTPGKWGVVTRPMRVILKALDRNLEPYELKAEGLLARAICHECDHMDGRLYIDLVEGDIFIENKDEEEEKE